MSQKQQAQPILSIIHFNDVYDIQPKGQLGGIVNFKAKVQQLRSENPNSLLLFSGDCLSPSILSNIFKGEQMVHALNQLNMDVACFGNHQFDYEHEHTVKLSRKCNFPWLLGNIRYTETEQLLGLGSQYIVLQKNNMKIGIFGIAGQDWLSILNQHYQDELTYFDHIQHSKKMCKILKQEKNCDIIISLTHMRNQADLQYPEQVPEVDIVLGGHDHVILTEVIDETPVVKSGCNFRNIGLIKVYKKQQIQNLGTQDSHIINGRRFGFNFHVLKVQKASQDKIDKQLENYVNQKMESYRKTDHIVGYTEIDLQTRFSIHRTQQTAYGNFMADLMRLYLDTDIAFANSGSIRNDCILPKGPLKYSQVSNIINDALVVKALSGKVVLQALEYSIEGIPDSFKGSFLHVSGLTYKYNSKLPPKSRIIQVSINGQQLDLQKMYSVSMYSYVAHGGDGFDFLKDCQTIKDQIQTTSMLNLLLKFFSSLNDSLLPQLETGAQVQINRIPLLKRKSSKSISRITSLQSSIVKGEDGKMYVSIKPKLQRRIVDIQELMKQQEQNENEIIEPHKKIKVQ